MPDRGRSGGIGRIAPSRPPAEPTVRTARLALLLAAGMSLSVGAIDAGSTKFATFAADLHDIVSDDQRGMLAEATDADGAGDQYHPSGAEPGIRPPEADLALGASFELEMTAAVAAAEAGSGGILRCDSDGTVCSPARAGEPFGTEFHAYAGTMAAPLVPGSGRRVEFGVVGFDETPRDARPAAAWEAIPEFRGDFFQGSNVTWTLLSENGERFRLLRLEYGPGDAGFLAAPTDAIALLRGSAWAILVPRAEWEGTVNSRLYTFRADGDDFAPATTVVDTYPDIFEPALPSAGRPTILLASTASRGFPTGSLVGLGIAALLAVLIGAWLVRRGRRTGSG
jgi:hypothetical protein